MTLRTKTLLFAGLALLVLLAALYFVSAFIMLRGFEALEMRDTRENLSRARDALSAKLEKLTYIARDWAEWDDTYEFIEDGNEKYIKSNLNYETIARLGLNLVLYVHRSGKLVFSLGLDLKKTSPVSIPKTITEHLTFDDLLLQPAQTGKSLTGLLLLPEGPMLITSRAVLTSESTGPVRGTLIFGQYLDESIIQELTSQTHLALAVYSLNTPSLPPHVQSAYAVLSEDSDRILVRPLNDQVITGYTLLNDIYGAPSLLLGVDGLREVYQQGLLSVRYVLLSMLAFGLIAGVILLWLLSKFLLLRLHRLSTEVTRIGAGGDLTQQVNISGQDELSRLGEAINKMLADLQDSRTRERETETRYHRLFDGVPVGLYRTTPTGQIVDANPALVQILGYPSRDDLKAVNATDLYVISQQRQQVIAESGRTGGSHNVEVQLRRYDGQIIWARINSRAVYDEQRQLQYLEGALEDITNRKQAEERLKTQARVLESMVEGVNIADENGVIVFTNPAFDQIFGYGPGELIGQHVSVLNRYTPEENARIVQEIAEQLKAQGAWIGEFHNRKKDGTPFITYARINALEISGRLHFVSVQEDITERKQAEAARHEAESRYRTLFEGVPVGIYRSTPRGQILDVNPALMEMLRYPSREALLATNALDLYADPRHRIQWEKRLQATGLVHDVEVQLRCYDGGIIWARDTSRVTYDHNGEALYYEGTLEDITERKQTEAALQKTEEEYRSIFENVPVGLYRTTPEGHILVANPTLVRMLGYPDLATLQRVSAVDLYVNTQERTRDNSVMESAEGSHQFEMQLRRRDGSPIWVKDTARAILGEQGLVLYYEGALEDVTERKMLEEVKSEFISMVSHELRTPLTSIRGYLEVILAGDVGAINAAQQEFLEIASANALRLTQLVNNLLDLNRIQSGQFKMEFKPLDLRDIFQEIVKIFRLQIEAKGLKFETEFESDLRVHGDRDHLTQTIGNLLSNAIKYTPRGSIRLTAYREIETSLAVIQVADTGIGMSSEDLKKLFQKFFRSSHGYVRQASGTGLGLSIAKSIIELHGGSIMVESELGHGSIFTVRLPALT
jgi:PAS domain S-box-containing protein